MIFRSTGFGKIDPSLIEASKDLGIIFPNQAGELPFLEGSEQRHHHISARATSFTIPYIVSRAPSNSSATLLKKNGVAGSHSDYPVGSLISILILVIVLGALYIISKVDAEGEHSYDVPKMKRKIIGKTNTTLKFSSCNRFVSSLFSDSHHRHSVIQCQRKAGFRRVHAPLVP